MRAGRRLSRHILGDALAVDALHAARQRAASSVWIEVWSMPASSATCMAWQSGFGAGKIETQAHVRVGQRLLQPGNRLAKDGA